MRSGDALFRVRAVYNKSVGHNPPPRIETREYLVAKPFFKPYQFVILKVIPVHGHGAESADQEFLVMSNAGRHKGEWAFGTTRALCSGMLVRHDSSLVSVEISLLDYDQISINRLRLKGSGSVPDDASFKPV